MTEFKSWFYYFATTEQTQITICISFDCIGSIRKVTICLYTYTSSQGTVRMCGTQHGTPDGHRVWRRNKNVSLLTQHLEEKLLFTNISREGKRILKRSLYTSIMSIYWFKVPLMLSSPFGTILIPLYNIPIITLFEKYMRCQCGHYSNNIVIF